MSEVLAVVIADRGGPGEREEALTTARRHLVKVGVEPDQVVRLDVPSARGSGSSSPTGLEQHGVFRPDLVGVVPLLQSSSLFGRKQGLLLVDANFLLAAEAQALAELIPSIDPAAVAVAIVAQRSLPNALSKKVKEIGKVQSIRQPWESQIHNWMIEQIKRRGLRMGYQARVALVQRFGTDRSALRRALEQLQGENRPVTADLITERFRNRPDQSVFRILDEILAGNAKAALRRLGDYLANARSSDGRPHILLGTLESDLRLRLKASLARDREHFHQMEAQSRFSRLVESAPGPLNHRAEIKLTAKADKSVNSSQRRLNRIWNQRKPLDPVSRHRHLLAAQKALSLVVRADRTLKLFPVPLHQPILERTVAEMSQVYRGFSGVSKGRRR
jgi:DNA polymerase III delta subunit